MNKIERKMLDILKRLKDEHGILAVKAEFEAEGSRTDELVQLNEVVFRADLDVFIKIGGCEAVRDLDQCRVLGATGIMAPMIETPFAMSKFAAAAKKAYGEEISDIEWIINTETKTCYDNIEPILDTAAGFLNTIAIGRVDLSGSLGLSRECVNTDRLFEMTKALAAHAKKRGIAVGVGGGISFDAIPFLMNINPYIDKFETRKIVFRASDNEQQLSRGILLAMEFETLYLENKCNFYDRMANEDRARLEMLHARLKAARGDVL